MIRRFYKKLAYINRILDILPDSHQSCIFHVIESTFSASRASCRHVSVISFNKKKLGSIMETEPHFQKCRLLCLSLLYCFVALTSISIVLRFHKLLGNRVTRNCCRSQYPVTQNFVRYSGGGKASSAFSAAVFLFGKE